MSSAAGYSDEGGIQLYGSGSETLERLQVQMVINTLIVRIDVSQES